MKLVRPHEPVGAGRALPVQDAGAPAELAPPGAVFVYHVHGRRQWYGHVKLHLRPDCRALRRWRPGSIGGRPFPRVLLRARRRRAEDVPERDPCRICWLASGG